jgi:hypothetical protein
MRSAWVTASVSCHSFCTKLKYAPYVRHLTPTASLSTTGKTLGSRKWQNLDVKTGDGSFVGLIFATSRGKASTCSQVTVAMSCSRYGAQTVCHAALSAAAPSMKRGVICPGHSGQRICG